MINTFKALDKQTHSNGDYSIIPIRMQDMEHIRIWRNSQMNVLRQKKVLSSKDQREYFKNIISTFFKLDEPEQLLFSFIKDSELIGYGGLVNISWIDKRAEVSFLLNNTRALNNLKYHEDFTSFIELIKDLCFNEMKFNRLFTETYVFRKLHIEILENSGFIKEGRLRHNIYENNKYHDSILHSILKEDYNAK